MLILGIDLQKPYTNIMPVLTNVLVENVSCIDVDVKTKRIYWSDVKGGAIRRAFLNGTSIETLIDTGTLLFYDTLKNKRDETSRLRFTQSVQSCN